MKYTPVVPGELHYWTSQQVLTGIRQEFDREFQPSAAPSEGQPIEFLVKGAGGLYNDLNHSLLVVEVQIVGEDGKALADSEPVGPVNGYLHSLFSHMELAICDKVVNQPDHMYPYRAYFDSLLNYTSDLEKTRGVLEGWVRDTTGKLSDTDPVGGANLGLKKRFEHTKGSKTWLLIGRPHIDLFHQDRPIPQLCDIRLKLIPNKDSFVLMSKAPSGSAVQKKYKVKILTAKFVVRTKEITANCLVAHEKLALADKESPGGYHIPFLGVTGKYVTLSAGSNGRQYDNLYTGAVPNRIVIGFVKSESHAGEYTSNPFEFNHCDVSSIQLTVRDRVIPASGLKPRFSAADYLKVYQHNLAALGLDIGDKAINWTPEDFANGHTLYVFDLKPGEGDIRGPLEAGSVKLDVEFEKAPTCGLSAIVFAEVPGLLTITPSRNAIVT